MSNAWKVERGRHGKPGRLAPKERSGFLNPSRVWRCVASPWSTATFRPSSGYLHFKNQGRAELTPPIIVELQALDCEFGPALGRTTFTLYHAEGSHEKITDFRPRQGAIGPGDGVKLSAFGGRSSDGTLPFFNVAAAGGRRRRDRRRLDGPVGRVVRAGRAGPVRVQAGMERIHTRRSIRARNFARLRSSWCSGTERTA